MSDESGALLRLAVSRHQAGDLEQAIGAYRRVLASRPRDPDALHLLGVALAQKGSYAEAVPLMSAAANISPGNATAQLHLGNALTALERHAEALSCYERVISLEPRNAQAHVRRGIAQARLGHLDGAEECFQRALRENPADADAHYNLGNIRAVLHRNNPALAIRSFSRALELNPRYPGARWNIALLKLLGGEWREGWELYEERFSIDAGRGSAPRVSQPRWTGREDLRGRRILLWAERGLGDTLQFCRYAPLVRNRGADVTLAVQPQLKALLDGRFTGVRVVGQDEPLGPFDYQCPLLSLPRAFDTQPDTIPASSSYLEADVEAVRSWSARLPGGAPVRVGIAWQGNAEAEKNWARGRSMPLTALAPLARREDVRLISLQTGQGARQLEGSDFADRILSFGDDLDAGPDAFRDTAAIVTSLDLVISTDTAIAHLAGALGTPVWVALHATSEWRWLLAREDSPWYAGMRLFRQRTLGRWDQVVEDICVAVGALRSTRPPSQGSGAA